MAGKIFLLVLECLCRVYLDAGSFSHLILTKQKDRQNDNLPLSLSCLFQTFHPLTAIQMPFTDQPY